MGKRTIEKEIGNIDMDKYKEIIDQVGGFEEIESLNPAGEDAALHELSKEAKGYLLRHEWCKSILSGWLAVGWEELVAVFLFEIEPSSSMADTYVWVVVGDIPPAYIDVESAHSPKEALESYVLIMQDWVDTVLQGKSVEACYPVEVPATQQYADMLNHRLTVLKDVIIPEF